MLIVCPKCFTQYLISDEIKLSDNQKFHCSSCGEYFVQPSEKEEKKESFAPVVALPEVLTGSKEEALPKDVSENAIFEAPVVPMDTESQTKENVEENVQKESLEMDLPSVPLFNSLSPADKTESPLDCVPEEFKPVEAKTRSGLTTLIWLLLGAGICMLAYAQKDLLLETVDNMILAQLDGSVSKKAPDVKEDVFDSRTQELMPQESASSGVSIAIDPMLKETIIQEKQAVSQEKPQQQEAPVNTVPAVQEEQVIPVIPETVVKESKEVLPAVQTADTPKADAQKEEIKNTVSEEAFFDKELNSKLMQDGLLPIPAEDKKNQERLKDILVARDIAYEIGANEAGTNRLLIRGNIVNTELKSLVLPQARAVVYDEQDNIVARKRIIFTQPEIEGNSTLSFETIVVPAPTGVSQIEVVFDE